MPADAQHVPSRWLSFRSSLRTQLIVISFVLMTVGAIARGGILLSFLQGELQSQVETQILSTAQYVAADVDSKIAERQDTLARLAAAFPLALLHKPGDARRWLADHQEIRPLFSLGLVLLSAEGRAVADSPAIPGRIGTSYQDQPWMRTVMEQGTPAIGRPTLGRVTHEPVLSFAAPIKDAKGHVVGILAGICALNGKGFLDLLQQGKVGETGGFLLISPQDDLVIAATEPGKVFKKTPPRGVNPLHDKAMEGYRGTGITMNREGWEELTAIVDVPRTGWFLVARIPTSEAFAPASRARSFIMRNSIWFGLTVIVVFFFGLRWVFRPLTSAAAQVRAMADGRQPLSPLPLARPDEVGELAAGFNRLLAQLQQREAILARLAHHDALTSLPNRIAFLDRVDQSLALAQRQGSGLALMFVDLDGFKPVNDDHGHEVGDQVLRLVADRLRDCVRKADMVARYGGDEFVILLTDVANKESAGNIAEKCIAALALPFQCSSLTLRIGASIGIALYPQHADSVESLLAEADAAMYQAKHAGRNTYRFPGTAQPASAGALDLLRT